MEKLAREASISELSSLFSVVRSGYYAWKKEVWVSDITYIKTDEG